MNSGQSRRWGGQFTWRVFSAFFHAVLFLSFLVFSQSQTLAQGLASEKANDLPSGLENRLFEAIEANQLKAVKRIVEKGVNICGRNENGLTPSNLALKKWHFEIARYLFALRDISCRRAALPGRNFVLLFSAPVAKGLTGRALRDGESELSYPANIPQISAVTPVPQTSTPRKSKLKSIALRKGNDTAGRVKKSWAPNFIISAAAEKDKKKAQKKINGSPSGTLTLGPSLQLGRFFNFQTAASRGCFKKGPAPSWFCVDAVTWPASIHDLFSVRSELYRGTMAITRFDKGRLSRVFVVFPQKNFGHVSDYFSRHWGAPSETDELPLALFGLPKTTNKILRWKTTRNEKSVSLVELREFDNLSGVLPNTRNSVLEIYRKGASPMFEYAERTDFLLRTIRLGSWEWPSQ